ncbi:MAG: hypothetical protein ABW123_13710 [Cystobacter sp.]
MSQAGNIKGPQGSSGFVPTRVSDTGLPGRGDRPGLEREEKTRIGRSPLDMGGPGGPGGPGGMREEKTRIGRSPLETGTTTSGGRPVPTAPEGESPRTQGPRETKGNGGAIDFSQDELVPRDTPRTERPRVGTSGVVFESAPPTDRSRPRARTDEGGGLDSDFESARPQGERPQVPTRARDTEGASVGEFDAPAELGSEVERPQVPARARDVEDASVGEFDEPWDMEESKAPQARAQVPARTRGAGEASSLETFEDAPELGKPPDKSKAGSGKGTGPEGRAAGTFEPARGQDTTRTQRGSPLPASSRGDAAGAGSHFEFAPAAKAPGGRLPGGVSGPGMPPPFLLGGSPARVGVKPMDVLLTEVAAGLIGQEALAKNFEAELLLLPKSQSSLSRSVKLWAMFTAYAEANLKNPQGQTPAGRQAFADALAAHGYAALRDKTTGRDGVTVAREALESSSPEELHQRLDKARMEPGAGALASEVSLPVAEEPPAQPPAEAQKESQKEPAARQSQAQSAKGFDQKEEVDKHPASPAAANAQAQVPNAASPLAAGPLVPRDTRQEWEEAQKERDRRRTNKKLGPHMLWNVLHDMRDSPEDSSLLKERWSQLAFGAIFFLAGAALLVALLVSL